jgi:hypothetical protein
VLALLAALLSDASRRGELARDGFETHLTEDLGAPAQAAIGHLLEDEFFRGAALDADTLCAGLAAWTLLMGAVSTEVFVQLGPDTIADRNAYFEYLLEVARRLVLRP